LVWAQDPDFSHFTGVENGHPFMVGHSADVVAQAPISHIYGLDSGHLRVFKGHKEIMGLQDPSLHLT